ncbi:MAG: adenylyltransferase [Desulfurococcales archaeon ex4484_58]|nr:MAG: adenylyltransferase [Desulfurococcales archaeon ex4484_58]
MKLSNEEIERYDRQIGVIGLENQLKLKNASVLVVGLGGLGSVASYYLVSAGIGRLILVDNEVVELSNLQRQILYTVDDLGRKKALVAKERLSKLNPNVEIIVYPEKFTLELGSRLVDQVDVIVDALDNWETRFLLDKLAFKHKKPLVHAGVEGFHGQLTTIIPGKTPCLRCIFHVEKPVRRKINVVATTPGVLGVLEVCEVIKLITGIGEVLANKILVYNGLTNSFDIVEIKSSDCKICYE